ncbi:serum response factor homolog [Agrilus planipennis]|uniref:Serum response factor homolog n=1 Tax=Agrilus planipennis TaxID=224129 RepID=A0A1W4WAC6_AGRPL|nr:serum response factor homolog [Agrilus planipennis]
MEPPGGRDSRFNLGYSMNLLSGETPPEIYGNPNLGRPSTSLQQLSPRHTMVSSACGAQSMKGRDVCYDERGMTPQGLGLEACGVNEVSEDTYNSLQSKKSPPSNGKKTKGRVKIKMEYIENKLRRYTTFSKRKTGIMKKAYELATLTGTQLMLLVASETGHVYTFATRKLQPMITSEAGKALIQTCLNSPDPPAGASSGGDQRMSAMGFEETELTYNISDEDSKEENNGSPMDSSFESSDEETAEIEVKPEVSLYFPPKPAQSPKTSSSQSTSNSSSSNNNNNSSATLATIAHPSSHTVTTSTITSSSSVSSSEQSKSTLTTTTPSTTSQPPPLISAPLLYQTPQGMMYAAHSNGGVIFSLAQGNSSQPPQFITIPLSLMANNGQELDLSKRK